MPENLPWFPLYVQDFLTSRNVKAMKHADVGCYFLLLCHEWDGGPLPLDMRELGALVGLSPSAMAKVWAVIGKCFAQTDLGYINERLEGIRQEQTERFERRSRAGSIAVAKRWESNTNGKADVYEPNTSRIAVVRPSNTIREEEIRTEEKKENPPSEGKRNRSGKGGRAAVIGYWSPSVEHLELAKERGVDLNEEEAKFRDFALNRKDPYRDLDAGFRNWLRNAKQFTNGAKHPPADDVDPLRGFPEHMR